MYEKLSSVVLVTNSRLHLTLLAMHVSEYRMNGGLGFAIKEPSCQLAFIARSKFKIDDQRSKPMSLSERQRLESILNAEQLRYRFDRAFNVSIEGSMLTHSGFGSGTAITLACLEALHLLNGHLIARDSLIQASERGGTSGIGIHTYFNGGCVFDLGKLVDNSQHVPSSQAQVKHLPLLLDQLVMPDWDIGICIPINIPNKTQSEEQAFFERACPISADSVYEATYHTLFGLYAAIKEGNKSAFSQALKTLQECTWKKLERNEYGQALADIETSLYTCGADAVGMSSLGPSLFFLAENVNEVVTKMRALSFDCELFVTQPENNGRILKHD